jgi:hypothetical protein
MESLRCEAIRDWNRASEPSPALKPAKNIDGPSMQ